MFKIWIDSLMLYSGVMNVIKLNMGQSIQEWTKENFLNSVFHKGISYFQIKNFSHWYCVKSVHIRIFSGPYFPAHELFLRIQSAVKCPRENAVQKNSECGQFLHSMEQAKQFLLWTLLWWRSTKLLWRYFTRPISTKGSF